MKVACILIDAKPAIMVDAGQEGGNLFQADLAKATVLTKSPAISPRVSRQGTGLPEWRPGYEGFHPEWR